MDPIIILQAGVATGTVLLFATIGEIFAERAGILNLGLEGMMLIGAMSAFSVTVATGYGGLGLVVAMLAAGVLSLLHGLVTIHFQADQVVSGLALTFLGAGLSLVFGEGLSSAGAIALLPTLTIPVLSAIPFLGPILFTNQSVMVYVGYIILPVSWFFINRTRFGLHLRAVGENPTAADAMGLNVYRLRYVYVFIGGLLAGLAGGTISLAISPGWFSELTTGGMGWIAIGLVIFAQWDPWRAAFGSYLFGALRRMILDIQGPQIIFGMRNVFFYNAYLGFFLQMVPFAFTIIVLILDALLVRAGLRKRTGGPAALGLPYVRGERGH
jgi:simple sugar transport system permease protein